MVLAVGAAVGLLFSMCVSTRRTNGFGLHWLLFWVLLCSVVGLIAGCSADATAQEGTGATTRPGVKSTAQPNIIFILTDDLDYASAYRFPSINSLLREQGAGFENDFVSYSLCCPSRATILTGLYAHNHDVRGNTPPDGGFQKFYSEGLEKDTIAVRLQQSGYKTALFGKYLNNFPGGAVRATYVPPGWDEWYGKLDEQKLYDYRINENGQVVRYDNNTEDFYTDVLSGQVVDFIRREAADSKPFFMYVAPTAPHMPADPAERHKNAFADEKVPHTPSFDEEDLSDKPSWFKNEPSLFAHPIISGTIRGIEELLSTHNYRKRLGSMLAVDDMVASLVQELKDVGKLDNTFIFFTSDNGWLQGEHHIAAGKVLPYEESVRVPLFVRGPGVPAGSKVDKLVLNTDFASTFADLAGKPYPSD